MKTSSQIRTTLICFALSGACVQAALYWDSNGTTDGAGTTPNGIWGTDAFWNATADGTTTAPAAWVTGEDAIFSAGTDGAGPFTVGIAGTQTAGNLTVEEGTITISGGTALNIGGAVAGKGIIDIAAGLTTTISTVLTGGDNTGQVTKSGDGTLIVNASCTYTGATTIAGGTLTLGAANLLNSSTDLSISNACVFDMNQFDQTVGGLYGGGEVLNGGTLTVGQNNEAAATFSGAIGSFFNYSPITLIKVGTGTQTLASPSYYSGPTIVAGGILAISDGDALGTLDSPTIVSNGAALQVNRGLCSETVIVNGEGFSGTNGALHNIAGTEWDGGVILGSNARINNEEGGTWNWLNGVNGNVGVDGTSAGGVFSVTFGGNGGTTQLKNGYRTIILNNAPVYKDGSSTLRFETPCVGVTALYLNGGWVLTRCGGTGDFMAPGSPIYVGPGAGGFDTGLNFSPHLSLPMVLAAGAKPAFNVRATTQGVPQNWNQQAVISGLGGLTKMNVGTLHLNAANTYSGNTTIQGGFLALGANGSISNSAVIDVQSGATFDVSAVTGGFVLGAAQTLKGTGTVGGNVTANGTLAPEAAATFGNLMFNNDLTLGVGAKLYLKVDRAGFPTSDTIMVLGASCTSIGAGTVQVTNTGGPLQVGDSFTIFNQPLVNGQALAVSGAGVGWTNKLWLDGSIAVVSLVPPVVTQIPRLTSLTLGGPISLNVTWTNVVVGSNYWLQYCTNLNTSNWTDLSPVTASGTTASQMDSIPAGVRQRYYRVRALGPGGGPPVALPRITSAAKVAATTVTLNYTNTVPGTSYVVQYTTNLNTTNWISLSPVTASGTISSTTDSLPAGAARRFYRVYGQF